MLLLVRLVTRKINLSRFLLQQRAFFEGLRLWKGTPTTMTNGNPVSSRTAQVSE
jgi:hypothetical protein